MRLEVLGPNVVVRMFLAGFWVLLAFLAMRTTPPFSEAWRPMAYSNSSQFHVPIHVLRNLVFIPGVPCRWRIQRTTE